MGISRYNASGYLDLTAHLAIRNVEEEKKIFVLKHPKGRIVIHLDVFFPCPLKRADKIFRLMRMYSDVSDQRKLQEYLSSREQRIRDQVRSYQNNKDNCTDKKAEKEAEKMLNQGNRSLEQLQRNMEQFERILEKKRSRGITA